MLVLLPCLVLGTHLLQNAQAWSILKTTSGVSVSTPIKLTKQDLKETDSQFGKEELWNGDADGFSLLLNIATVKTGDKSTLPEMFTDAITDLMDSDKDVIIGERDLLLQGWPGLAFTIRRSDGTTLVSRVFLVDNVVINVNGLYPTGAPRPAAIDRFLDSVRLPGTGTTKQAGPQLARFPFGDNGLSALFLCSPARQESESGKGAGAVKVISYVSTYALRTFSVSYQDLPVIQSATLVGKKLDWAESQYITGMLQGLGAKKVKEQHLAIGPDPALCADFTRNGNFAGKVLAYVHKDQVIILLAAGPAAYGDPKEVDLFLHSVESAPSVTTWTEQVFPEGVRISAPIVLAKKPMQNTDPAMSSCDCWQGRSGHTAFVFGISKMKDPAKVTTVSVLTGSSAGFVSSDKIVVFEEKYLLEQGWQGVGLGMHQAAGMTMITRSFRISNALVTALCVYPTAEPQPPDVLRYLDSLRLPTGGTETVAGPTFTRYPLGDSGITALFLSPPNYMESKVGRNGSQSMMHRYASGYCLREFAVAYIDIPDSVMAHLTPENSFNLESSITEEALQSLHAKQTKQLDDHIGKDIGLRTEFTIDSDAKGRILVFLHQTRIVCILQVGPSASEDAKQIDLLFHSVEFKQ
jgi:hypothetical protein